MSKIVVDDEGKEETVYTQAELEAEKIAAADKIAAIEKAAADKIAANEAHVAQKLDEFSKGKTSQELKDAERDVKIAEAKAIAEAANKANADSEARRLDTLKKIAMEQYIGADPELVKKFEESWGLINLEIKSDEDIAKKAGMVANLIGINSNASGYSGGMPMSGGFAPRPNQEQKTSDADHQRFLEETGLKDFIPK